MFSPVSVAIGFRIYATTLVYVFNPFSMANEQEQKETVVCELLWNGVIVTTNTAGYSYEGG